MVLASTRTPIRMAPIESHIHCAKAIIKTSSLLHHCPSSLRRYNNAVEANPRNFQEAGIFIWGEEIVLSNPTLFEVVNVITNTRAGLKPM